MAPKLLFATICAFLYSPRFYEPMQALFTPASVRTLYAIAGAFSGTSPSLFIGRALLRALAQEARLSHSIRLNRLPSGTEERR